MLEILHEELKEMRSKKALPQRETLIPLLGYSVRKVVLFEKNWRARFGEHSGGHGFLSLLSSPSHTCDLPLVSFAARGDGYSLMDPCNAFVRCNSS